MVDDAQASRSAPAAAAAADVDVDQVGHVIGRAQGVSVGVTAEVRGASMGPHAGRAPRGYRRADDRIYEDVCERLTADPQLDPTDIDVNVDGGIVTLSGSVEDRHSKRRAEDVAYSTTWVRDVRNQLEIASPEPRASEMS